MAKMAATIQDLSSGRFVLGNGAGWHEGEHRAFGITCTTKPNPPGVFA